MSNKGWMRVPLRDIASDIKDGTHGTHKRVASGIPFLSAKNVVPTGRLLWSEDDDFISEYEYQAITSSFAPKQGDLLITVVGTLGRTALFDGSKVAFQRSVAFVRPNSRIISNYLFQASKDADFTRQMERRSNATAQAGLYLGELAKIQIPLPTIAQQQRIANILSTIDRTITHTEALIEKYQQIKAGLMHDLFTRGIGADGKLRPPRDKAPELYQESSIGWIPKEWDIETLKNTFGAKNIVNGPFGSDLLTSELKKEGVPVLYCQDIKPGFFDRVSHSNVTSVKAAQLSFCNVHKNDILLAKVGSPPCDSCIYDEDVNAVVTQDVIRIRPSARHDSQFFSSWFNSGYGRRAIKKISIEGTRERVSLGDFKNLLIPLPNSLEQKEIGKKISQAQVVIAKEKINLQKLKNQKSGLMHDLLTGTVGVNIDPV
jgi:type I restriction enzyme, S subunit